MGFLDKAKAAATDMMSKADAALNSAEGSFSGGANARQAEPFLRDLGVLAYLEATGRPPADLAEQRERCTQALGQLESQVALNLALSSANPPAPGAAAAGAPPPPGAAAAPPPPGAAAPPPPPAAPPAAPPPPPPPGSVAPPPPPGATG